MTCDHISAELSGYLDNELHSPDVEIITSHLQGCNNCRSLLETLRALKHSLARLPSTEAPPGAVRARVEALRFEPARPRDRRLVFGAAAAAVLALAFFVGRSQPPASRFADDLIADHLHSVPEVRPAEVTSTDPQQVAAFFSGHLPFEAVVPRLPRAGLIGGRLCRLEGRRVELLFYDHAGSTLSLFVTDRTQSEDGCESAREHRVCSRRHGDLTLFLVGALPEAELRSLLADSSL